MSSDSDVMISVRGLSKSYTIARAGDRSTTLAEVLIRRARSPFGRDGHEKFWALQDVSFNVNRGDTVGVIGRNGAGKSTLLKLLSRIAEPTVGAIDLFGSVGSLLEVGTGFSAELTGRENIFLNGAILGMRRTEVKKSFDEIVEFAGVEKFIDTPVKRYSSGMYVRLAFAVAAHLRTEILIVDEVLAVGDSEFQKKALGRIRQVGSDGRTVLFVSHTLALVQNLCNVGLMLDSGRVAATGNIKQVVDSYMKATLSDDVAYQPAIAARTGTGLIQFNSFHLENTSGERVKSIQSGDGVTLVFGYTADSKVGSNQVVNIGFGLHSSKGDRLAVFYASDIEKTFRNLPVRGHFRCVLPRLDLAPDRVSVLPRLEIGGIEADFPREGVGNFLIEAGDYFGTGRPIGERGLSPFLIRGEWTVD